MNKRKISRLCFGCEALGGTDWGKFSLTDVEDAILESLDLGVNFFDTAAVYGLGLSEIKLSDILGDKRHDLYIATKGGLQWENTPNGKRAKIVKDSSASSIKSGVKNSLQRLKLDIIPIYYVHWPDPNIPFEETFEILNKLKERELIGGIGCSNFTPAQVEKVLKISDIEYLQIPVNIFNSKILDSFLPLCSKNQISIVAYNVLANGLLTGKFNCNSLFPHNDRRSRLDDFKGSLFKDNLNRVKQIRKIADREGQSLAQYSINWILRKELVSSAITGIKNVNQLRENASLL